MENMKEVKAIQSLDEMTLVLKNELENIAEGFIAVGYYLKKTRDDELYRQSGYKSIFEYAQAVFGISRFTATRFMEVNDRYSIGGYSPQIEEKYRGYGSSKLTEMLQLPEDIREAVPQEATVRDIREAKTIVKETEKHYSDQMELCDIAQEESPETAWLEELVKNLFKNDCKRKFKEFVLWLKSPEGRSPSGITEDILALINPTKFKMVRLEKANIMLQAEKICVMPYRNQGERREYTYIDLAKAFEAVFFSDGMSKNAETAYEEVYEEPLYPETKKERPAEPKTLKKSENTKSKAESKEKERKIPKKEPETQEKPENTKSQEDLPEELPGQMEISKDFPEYCPEETKEVPEKAENVPKEVEAVPQKAETVPVKADTVPEEIDTVPEEPEAAGHPYKTRLEYMQGLSVEEYAHYIANTLQAEIGHLTFRHLTDENFWKEWITRFVDESGRTIEEG